MNRGSGNGACVAIVKPERHDCRGRPGPFLDISGQNSLAPHRLVESRGPTARRSGDCWARQTPRSRSACAAASVESAWQLAAALTHGDPIGVHFAEFLPRGALDVSRVRAQSTSFARGWTWTGQTATCIQRRLTRANGVCSRGPILPAKRWAGRIVGWSEG